MRRLPVNQRCSVLPGACGKLAYFANVSLVSFSMGDGRPGIVEKSTTKTIIAGARVQNWQYSTKQYSEYY